MVTQRWDGRQKARARSVMVRPLETGPAKMAAFLPGVELRCMDEAVKTGLVSQRTRLLLAEADPDIATKITKQLRKRKWLTKPYLFRGPIETLQTPVVLRERKLDYSFFDFCSPLNPLRCRWVSQIANHLAADGIFSLTLQRNRPNDFVKAYVPLLGGSDAGALKAEAEREANSCYLAKGGKPTICTIRAIMALWLSTEAKVHLRPLAICEYCSNDKPGGSSMVSIRFRVQTAKPRDSKPHRRLAEQFETLVNQSADAWSLPESI